MLDMIIIVQSFNLTTFSTYDTWNSEFETNNSAFKYKRLQGFTFLQLWLVCLWRERWNTTPLNLWNKSSRIFNIVCYINCTYQQFSVMLISTFNVLQNVFKWVYFKCTSVKCWLFSFSPLPNVFPLSYILKAIMDEIMIFH